MAQSRPISPFITEPYTGQEVLDRSQAIDPLMLRVVAPSGTDGLFSIGQNTDYDPASREINFSVTGPLACFDIAPIQTGNTRIVARDPALFPSIDLFNANAFAFDPLARFIQIEASEQTACFWDVPLDQAGEPLGDLPFALFGQPVTSDGLQYCSDSGSCDGIFRNRFEREPARLEVTYSGVPEQVGLNVPFTYTITIRNVGSTGITNLGIAELVTNDPLVSEAVLAFDQDSLDCAASGGAVCGSVIKTVEPFPGLIVQLPFFRSDFGDGSSLPPNGVITLTAGREAAVGTDQFNTPLPAVDAVGETLDLSAVAVSLDETNRPIVWSSARASTTVVINGMLAVIGAPVGPVTVSSGTGSLITVQAQTPDEQALQVPDLDVNASTQNQAAAVSPAIQATDSSGQAVFSVGSEEAGTVFFTFTANDLVTSGGQPATITFPVTFEADAAQTIRFETALDPSYDVGATLPAVEVCAVDQFGNIADDRNGQNLQLFLFRDGKQVRGPIGPSQTILNGCANFAAFDLDQQEVPGTGYRLVAQRLDISGFSQEFEVTNPAAP